MNTIDEYIEQFPEKTQTVLQQVRATIRKTVPKESVETISYGIPCFKLNKNIIHFAGYTKHIGLYPGAATIVAFKKEIEKYKSAKGSIQFPLDKPMPIGLIVKIVKFKLKAESAKLKTKKK